MAVGQERGAGLSQYPLKHSTGPCERDVCWMYTDTHLLSKEVTSRLVV